MTIQKVNKNKKVDLDWILRTRTDASLAGVGAVYLVATQYDMIVDYSIAS